jgi:hypothetical protein
LLADKQFAVDLAFIAEPVLGLRTGQLEAGGPAAFRVDAAQGAQITRDDEIADILRELRGQFVDRYYRRFDTTDIGIDDLRVAGLGSAGGLAAQ